MEPSIKILNLQIPIYGVCWMSGIFLAAFIALSLSKKTDVEKFDIVCSAVYAVIGGMIGSKLLFIVVTLRKIIEDKIPVEAVIKGGFVFYGGLIGGIIGLSIYTTIYKLKFLEFADIYACVLPLGHALGRVGCFVSGCCYGMPYNGAFGIVYTETLGGAPLGISIFPIQILEALLLTVLFAVLLILFIRINKKGIVAAIYLYSYSIIRFALEFFRGDTERGSFMRLSTSQIISIIILLILSVLILLRRKYIKKDTLL